MLLTCLSSFLVSSPSNQLWRGVALVALLAPRGVTATHS